jgi:hypothetical protein
MSAEAATVRRYPQLRFADPQVNCVVANVATFCEAHGFPAALLLGGMLCLERPMTPRAYDYLATLVSSHLAAVWDLEGEAYHAAPPAVWASEAAARRFLAETLGWHGPRMTFGITLPAAEVFFRQDIDLAFWGADAIYHYVIVELIDRCETCTVVDAAPGKLGADALPVVVEVPVSRLLAAARGGKHVHVHDLGLLRRQLEARYADKAALVPRFRASLSAQAAASLASGGATAWLLAAWETLASPGTDGWGRWLTPRVNLFQIWRTHRALCAAALAAAATAERSTAPAEEALRELETRTERLRNLCFKLEASPAERHPLIRTSGARLLEELATWERHLATRILELFTVG